MFYGHLDYFQKPPLGDRSNTKPGDHGIPNAHNRWFVLFYHAWGPAWIEIHWNSIGLRARSHMTSNYTWRSVTTLHDFEGVLGRPLDTLCWALTSSWSRLLARVWSGPQHHCWIIMWAMDWACYTILGDYSKGLHCGYSVSLTWGYCNIRNQLAAIGSVAKVPHKWPLALSLPSTMVHHLWYLVSRTLFAKGLNSMPRCLKMYDQLIVKMIPFANISNFFKWKNIYIMTFRVAHWDTLYD